MSARLILIFTSNTSIFFLSSIIASSKAIKQDFCSYKPLVFSFVKPNQLFSLICLQIGLFPPCLPQKRLSYCFFVSGSSETAEFWTTAAYFMFCCDWQFCPVFWLIHCTYWFRITVTLQGKTISHNTPHGSRSWCCVLCVCVCCMLYISQMKNLKFRPACFTIYSLLWSLFLSCAATFMDLDSSYFIKDFWVSQCT